MLLDVRGTRLGEEDNERQLDAEEEKEVFDLRASNSDMRRLDAAAIGPLFRSALEKRLHAAQRKTQRGTTDLDVLAPLEEPHDETHQKSPQEVGTRPGHIVIEVGLDSKSTGLGILYVGIDAKRH